MKTLNDFISVLKTLLQDVIDLRNDVDELKRKN